MGQRIMRFSRESLRDALKLPASMVILAVSDDVFFEAGDIAIKVESAEFSEVQSGCGIPHTYPEYSAYSHGCGHTTVELTGFFPDRPTDFEKWKEKFEGARPDSATVAFVPQGEGR